MFTLWRGHVGEVSNPLICPDKLCRSWTDSVGEVNICVTLVLKVEQEGSSKGEGEELVPPAREQKQWAGAQLGHAGHLLFAFQTPHRALLHPAPWPRTLNHMDHTVGLASGWIWVFRGTHMRLKRGSRVGSGICFPSSLCWAQRLATCTLDLSGATCSCCLVTLLMPLPSPLLSPDYKY